MLARGITTTALFLAACHGIGGKKSDGDAGPTPSVAAPEAVDAAPVREPDALALNQGDITRFPDETALSNVRSTFLRPFSVREAPPMGAIIAGLPKGAVVTQIAQRASYVLILFDNPKQAGTRLMGWVGRDAFLAPADARSSACVDGEGKVCADPDVVAAEAGRCPGDFVFVTKTGKCHRPCTTSTSKTECHNNPYFCERCDADNKRVCLDSHTQCR